MLTILLALAALVGDHPSIKVVVLDDIGNDRLAIYGEGSVVPFTPFLDEFAASGLVFDNFYTSPTCSPTRASLLTGLRPADTGIGSVINRVSDPTCLSMSAVTIPEALDLFSYSSAFVGKWHLSINSGLWPLDPILHGFDFYAGSLANLTDYSD